MNTIKNFRAHRRQDGFVLVEIALVALLSFFFLDNFVVTAYDTYFCRPAGEFEREHLLVGTIGTITADLSSVVVGNDVADSARLKPFEQEALQKIANQKALRDQVRALPEVQSAGLIDYHVGTSFSNYPYTYCVESDTAKWCSAFQTSFIPGEQFFETLGLTAIDGSPSAAQLSEDCPEDGAVITRSMALTLFGTDQVIGRRIVEMDHSDAHLDGNDPKALFRYRIAGVIEDFRLRPHERHAFSIIIPRRVIVDYGPKMLVRLRPEVDPVAFISRLTLPGDIKAGNQSLAYLETYTDYEKDRIGNNEYTIVFSIMGIFIALLLLNVVLGTLGTFWLQIRKRTEDIGIMRSFGAKRRHIFAMLWKEAALLTFIAAVIGQTIWLQFAMNVGLADGFSRSGTGQEGDWVNTFWLHFLIVCAIQYVLLLIIVTLGMVVPTVRAMYKRPVEALHHE